MANEFWPFAVSVASHWVSLLTGGIIVLTIGVWERLTRKSVPRQLYFAIMGSALFISCFLAWREEHSKTEHLALEFQEVNPLSPTQRESLRASLSKDRGASISIVVMADDRRVREFATQMQTAFTAAGWSNSTSFNVGGLRDKKSRRPQQRRFALPLAAPALLS